MKKYLILLILLIPIAIFAQKSKKVLIEFTDGNLRVGIDNYMTIVAQQDKPVSIDQVKAYLYTMHHFYYENTEPYPQVIEEKYGQFMINPDSLGAIEIHVELESGVEIIHVRAKPLTVICSVGSIEHNESVTSSRMKSQEGIIASVSCCGLYAQCKVLDFEILRISKKNRVKRSYNKGSRFEETSLKLLQKAKVGDAYIFRKIRHRCPGNDEPPFDDIMVEIREN